MDHFVNEKDYALLENDKYTFFVLGRIMGGECRLFLTDHDRLIICHSVDPFPVWIWTPDDITEAEKESAYRITEEQGLLNGHYRFNLKYDLAEYIIERGRADGKQFSLSMNLLAYDCPEPIEPATPAEGGIHLCTEEDLEELVEFLDLFHQTVGIDQKDSAGYCADAIRYIESGRFFFWQDERGQNVASCTYAPTDDLASINLVYTREGSRRKHYAENLVYQVAARAKAEGFTPMLYTNADYVASNACYEGIGFIRRGKLCTIE